MSTDHEAGITAAAQTLQMAYGKEGLGLPAWEILAEVAVNAYLAFLGVDPDRVELRDVMREASALIYAMSPGKARELLQAAL